MTIEKARKILGKKAEKMTDEEVSRLINTLRTLADIAIDQVIKMTPEELKEYNKQLNKVKSIVGVIHQR